MEGIEQSAPEDEQDVGAAVLVRFKNSMAPEHQQLRAVVSAIIQVLKDQGLPLTPTAYFGACMSALELQFSGGATGGADTSAFCTFLAMVLPKLSKSVLRSRSGRTLELLVDLLNSDKVDACTIKALLSCLQHVLAAADIPDWLMLLPAFRLVLKFAVDLRPKVRKRAHSCLADIMSNFQGTPALEKASEALVSCFEQRISTVGISATTKASKSKAVANPVGVLHVLGALRNVLSNMSAKSIAKLLPNMVTLVQLKQAIVTRQVLDVLLVFFMKLRTDLPQPEAGKILQAVCSLISTGNRNVDEVTSAVRVLQYGLLNLTATDPGLCVTVLPAPFHAITELLASEQEEVAFSAVECLRSLVENCVSDEMIHQGVSKLESNGNYATSIEHLCASVESTLSYQYSGNWDKALHVISCFFQRLDVASYRLMAGTIMALADLQNLSDEDMPFRKQLHETLGHAVSAMGPDLFLKLLPLEMDPSDLGKARLWLLPILKQHIVGAKLSYFSGDIIPLASVLFAKAKEFSADGKVAAARNAEACARSLWALLPSFCNYPLDTKESFQLIAKPLGDAMKDVELRGLVCTSLQLLIKQNKIAKGDLDEDDQSNKVKPKSYYTTEVASANLSVIAAFSNNFLPLFFNLFCGSSAAKRGDLQAAIDAIASISSKESVQKFFKTVLQKLLDATKATDGDDRRVMFMDLALSLIGGLDDGGLRALFAIAKPALQDKNSGVQKKGYKILASICKKHPTFLAAKASDIFEMLQAGTSTCHSAAKQYRILCLQALALHLVKVGDVDSSKLLLKEAILALKEVNKKTRNAAYDFVIGIAHSLREEDEGRSKLVQFFVMVVGCSVVTKTAGEPHVISAAVSGISRMVYEFPVDLEGEVEKYLPSAYYLLSNYKSREVIKSLLGLMKVVAARLPAEKLAVQLRDMVRAMMTWSDDSKNRFRAKVRVILEKLVRKCGFDAVSAVMPPQHAKHLTNIRKRKEQLEKKKQQSEVDGDDNGSIHSRATSRRSKWNHTDFFSDEGEEDSDDDDDETQMKSRSKSTVRSKKLAKSKKRLPEEDMTESGRRGPLNLLDVPMTRAALSAPKGKSAKGDDGSDEEMRFDPDGRLVVEESPYKKKRQREEDNDEEHGGDLKSRGSKKSAKDKASKRMKKSSSSWVYKGDEYSSKKGGGDVKKAGKLEPYAYWPLDPKLLNRRQGKKAAARKGMQSVFKMTKKMEGLNVDKALAVSSRGGARIQKKKHKKKA